MFRSSGTAPSILSQLVGIIIRGSDSRGSLCWYLSVDLFVINQRKDLLMRDLQNICLRFPLKLLFIFLASRCIILLLLPQGIIMKSVARSNYLLSSSADKLVWCRAAVLQCTLLTTLLADWILKITNVLPNSQR